MVERRLRLGGLAQVDQQPSGNGVPEGANPWIVVVAQLACLVKPADVVAVEDRRQHRQPDQQRVEAAGLLGR